MNNRFAGALVVLFMVVTLPAFGGRVSISGDAIVFEAGSDEENALVVVGRGSVLDQSTGQVLTGPTIVDINHTTTALAPCRVLFGTAICDVTRISRAVIRAARAARRVSRRSVSPDSPS